MRSTIRTSYWPSIAMREPLLAVGGKVGNVPDLTEGLDQIIGGIAIVFDDQETHDGPAISTVGAFPHCGGTVSS